MYLETFHVAPSPSSPKKQINLCLSMAVEMNEKWRWRISALAGESEREVITSEMFNSLSRCEFEGLSLRHCVKLEIGNIFTFYLATYVVYIKRGIGAALVFSSILERIVFFSFFFSVSPFRSLFNVINFATRNVCDVETFAVLEKSHYCRFYSRCFASTTMTYTPICRYTLAAEKMLTGISLYLLW